MRRRLRRDDDQRQAQEGSPLLGPLLRLHRGPIVKKDSGITDLASLKGKKLGVQTDTTGQEFGDKEKAANGYTPVVFDDLPTQFAAVLSGRVDAAVNDNGPLLDYAKDNPTTAVVKEFDTGEQYGLMFKLNDPNGTKLAELTNEVLKTASRRRHLQHDLQEVVRSRRPEVTPVRDSVSNEDPSASSGAAVRFRTGPPPFGVVVPDHAGPQEDP